MLRLLAAAALVACASLPAQRSGLVTVYTLTNDAQDNRVQVGVSFFGHLLPFASYSTGGRGTASGLGSQGALASVGGNAMLAVNPGSNTVTLFEVKAGVFLSRLDVAETGGRQPTSVAAHGDLVYVLNASSDELSGFHIRDGRLRPIGRFPLSQAGAAGAQVGFDPRGRFLAATERNTNRILVYPVQKDGGLGKPTVNPSAAPTPFGFLFRKDGVLVVSEAAGGMTNASAVSTYEMRKDGSLRTITAASPTMQTAACWIALPPNGRFAYTTNTGSGTITGYRLDSAGLLTHLDANGVTADLGATARPIDFDFDRSGHLLFVLDSGNDAIVGFCRDSRGGLHRLGGKLVAPDGAAGLLAR